MGLCRPHVAKQTPRAQKQSRKDFLPEISFLSVLEHGQSIRSYHFLQPGWQHQVRVLVRGL